MNRFKVVHTISQNAYGSQISLIYNPRVDSYAVLATIPLEILDTPVCNIRKLIDHQSQHIAQVYQVCIKKGKVWIMEEFVKGRKLGDILQNDRKTAEKDWKQWKEQIRGGLQYLHNMKPLPLYHGDIHPNNIIINDENQAKIIDFSSIKTEDQPYKSRIHAVKEFLDPRILNGAPYDGDADLYSLRKMMRLFERKTT